MGSKEETAFEDDLTVKLYDATGKLKITRSTKQRSKLEKIRDLLLRILEKW